MKATLTAMSYMFSIDDEQFLTLLGAEENTGFPKLANRLSAIEGVESADYDREFGPNILVSFRTDTEGNPVGYDDAQDMIEIHLDQCEKHLIYVGNGADGTNGRTALHYGDGFVLCNNTSGPSDLGVSLHFLDNGDQAVKWFTDGAAQQFRELADLGDARRIKSIVAKHIDLDPSSGPRP